MTLMITKELKNDTMIWHLKGTMDISTTVAFPDKLDDIDHSITTLILDFVELEFIDSTGIGFLMQLIYYAKENVKKLIFRGLNELNRDTFETIGIFHLLKDIQGELE